MVLPSHLVLNRRIANRKRNRASKKNKFHYRFPIPEDYYRKFILAGIKARVEGKTPPPWPTKEDIQKAEANPQEPPISATEFHKLLDAHEKDQLKKYDEYQYTVNAAKAASKERQKKNSKAASQKRQKKKKNSKPYRIPK